MVSVYVNSKSRQNKTYRTACLNTLPPVIKWSGSKRSQAEDIIGMFPKFNTYYEPFVGGGSVMVRTGATKAVCGDICEPLIELWKLIRDDPDSVAKSYKRTWSTLQKKGQDVYYDTRKKFNDAHNPNHLLFITRTCVNGLIRFNGKGEFNNAFHITRPGIKPQTLDKIIHAWSQRIQNYTFIHGDYRDVTKNVTRGDFVYLDPPYFNTTGMYYGSISYPELLDYLEDLNSRNVNFAMSFDGRHGDEDRSVDIPKHLYKHSFLLYSGLSPFRKIMTGNNDRVRESVYLNF